MVIGNTAYLLSYLLDNKNMCEIERMEKNTLLDDNGRKVLAEVKEWVKSK
jgi:hypothetical protein